MRTLIMHALVHASTSNVETSEGLQQPLENISLHRRVDIWRLIDEFLWNRHVQDLLQRSIPRPLLWNTSHFKIYLHQLWNGHQLFHQWSELLDCIKIRPHRVGRFRSSVPRRGHLSVRRLISTPRPNQGIHQKMRDPSESLSVHAQTARDTLEHGSHEFAP